MKMKRLSILALVLSILLFGIGYAVVHYVITTQNSFNITVTWGISLQWEDSTVISSLVWGDFSPETTTKTSADLHPQRLMLMLVSTDNVAEGYCAWSSTGLPSWMRLQMFYQSDNSEWLPNTYNYIIHARQSGPKFWIQLTANWAEAIGGFYTFNIAFKEADSPSG